MVLAGVIELEVRGGPAKSDTRGVIFFGAGNRFKSGRYRKDVCEDLRRTVTSDSRMRESSAGHAVDRKSVV